MSNRHGSPQDDRDDVARLLRIAGKRPSVPEDRVERVRRTAHARWTAQVRRRAGKRRAVLAAAGLATAAALALAFALSVRMGPDGHGRGGTDGLRVELLRGRATGAAGPADRDRLLAEGERLPVGARIATGGRGGAAIRLASGHSLRLRAGTTLRLVASGTVSLDRGTLYVDSGAGRTEQAPIDVVTPLGTIREIGTQYEVRIDDEGLRLRLREGVARLNRGADAHEVAAGNELHVDRDGEVVRRPAPTSGPAWDWLVDVTPPIDLEGRTARSFLDWVARERGWSLEFADDAAARSAEEIVLGGSIDRLTPDEALDAVLPTCRMTYRVRDGALVVSGATSPE